MKTPLSRLVRLILWCQSGWWFYLFTVHAAPLPLTPASLETVTSQPPLFKFAQSLYAAGEYYRAIGEFQRFLFFQPDHPLAAEAQQTIGLAYFCGARWLQAFELFRQISRVTSNPAVRAEAALWMAEARARGGDHMEAIRLYQEAIRQDPSSNVAHRATYLIGWGYLRQRQWTEAREALAQVDNKSPYHASAERLATALDPPPELPQRSPIVARLLSTVLPGAGQLYTGHTLDGLIGIGLHGALITGTTGAVLAGLEGAAGISAFFTWGFYQTQMTNAAVLAQEFNAQAGERFIGQLSKQEGPFLNAFVRALPCTP